MRNFEGNLKWNLKGGGSIVEVNAVHSLLENQVRLGFLAKEMKGLDLGCYALLTTTRTAAADAAANTTTPIADTTKLARLGVEIT
jgi:hypothetical protein